MKNPTDEQVSKLADAMCMVLNDLADGNSVCDLVKAEARVAMEPFLLDDNGELPDLEWAEKLIEELTGHNSKASAAQNEHSKMTEDQIKHMAARFLNWKLPANFNPDGGVSFEKIGNKGTPHEYTREPVGTNLIGYTEAVAMVRHMIEGLPQSSSDIADKAPGASEGSARDV